MLAQVRDFQDRLEEETEEKPATTSSPKENPRPTVGTPLARAGPTKFLTGLLASVDCTTPPTALLTVASGNKTLKMKVSDRSHLVLIGADEFSCSWTKQKIALNYRETPDADGMIVSLEIQ